MNRFWVLFLILTWTAEAHAVERVRVQAGWLLNGEFAAFCSALVNGIYADYGLDVTLLPGGPSGGGFIVATNALVQDQTIDIAIDGDLVPLMRGTGRPPERQINVKAFAAFWTDSPYGFLVREDSGIHSLRDLAGGSPDGKPYRVGVTADFVLQDALARHAGGSPDQINFVTVGFDALPLITGSIDAQAGYWVTQAYELVQANISYRFLPISELPGFHQPSLIALARKETIEQRPEMLARWLRASQDGARFVLSDPETAAKQILDSRCGGPSFDFQQESWLIRQSLSLYNPADLGRLDPTLISSFATVFKEIGQIQRVPIIEDVYTDKIQALAATVSPQ
ncbi:MAG: ABC transporter substrate-binding protein [Propylenella sp.]